MAVTKLRASWNRKTENVFVWDVDDIMRLRREWRIMGSLVGTIDRCSEVGPPLKLSRDEVTLLLQKGVLSLYQAELGREGIEEGDWTYPKTTLEVSIYAVFKELWNKGFYITSGMKFGGDFLLYSGDPVVCHACCVVRVCSVKDQLITVHQLSTVGRVATCAKKMIMWAAPDEKGKLLFILQEWTGPEKKAIPKYNIVTDCTEVLKSCKRVK